MDASALPMSAGSARLDLPIIAPFCCYKANILRKKEVSAKEQELNFIDFVQDGLCNQFRGDKINIPKS